VYFFFVFACIVSFIYLFPHFHYCFLPYTAGIEEKKDWLYTSFKKKVVFYTPKLYKTHLKGSQITHFKGFLSGTDCTILILPQQTYECCKRLKMDICSFANWRKIGAGGLGVVWEAEWKDGGSMGLPPPKYAIKVIFPSFAIIAIFIMHSLFAYASKG
jgi:hypothetical protein